VTPADSRLHRASLLLVAGLLNAALLWTFHDQQWYVVDEGNYAHIAERLLSGEVLHRDVQDLHPGFINFVNTAAFGVFGINLVSLRYPLVAAMFAVSLLVWWLLARRSLLLATVASVSVNALGVVQFLNPTAHWYSLFATVVLVG
jgi:predicted membrane-bound mannosyltransferase